MLVQLCWSIWQESHNAGPILALDLVILHCSALHVLVGPSAISWPALKNYQCSYILMQTEDCMT